MNRFIILITTSVQTVEPEVSAPCSFVFLSFPSSELSLQLISTCVNYFVFNLLLAFLCLCLCKHGGGLGGGGGRLSVSGHVSMNSVMSLYVCAWKPD